MTTHVCKKPAACQAVLLGMAVAACLAVCPSPAQARGKAKPKPTELQTVANMDLKKYMGVWYEISRYPNAFQKGLVGVTAEYRLLPSGKISVTNRAYKGSIEGKLKTSNAKGWLEDRGEPAIWNVQFIWPFKADYWVIDLCEDYQYAVVGQPSRKHLWVLSRTPSLDEATYQRILERLERQAYDSSRLVMTEHAAPPPSE